MPPPAAVLDHLVVAADTLDQGTRYVQERLGIAPAGGGSHAAMGTHNRVLKLGRDRYLEVIAIDPEGQRPDFPRWFNLDHSDLQRRLAIRPRLITWVVRTDRLDALAKHTYGRSATIRPMQRDSLRWRFAFTNDGSMPGNGLIPHMIQWEGGRHPAESMLDSGCVVAGLAGTHTDPASVQRMVSSMGLDHAITIHPASKNQVQGLSARIHTPTGMVLLD